MYVFLKHVLKQRFYLGPRGQNARRRAVRELEEEREDALIPLEVSSFKNTLRDKIKKGGSWYENIVIWPNNTC